MRFAGALTAWPDISVTSKPRMADFARFGEAVGQTLKWGNDAFIKAYKANISGVAESSAEASSVATVLINFMSVHRHGKGCRRSC